MWIKLSFANIYYDFWVKLLEHYGPFSERMHGQLWTQSTSHEWIGLYKNKKDVMPEWVVCVGYFKEFTFGIVQFSVKFMGTFSKSTLKLQYFTLLMWNQMRGMHNTYDFLGLDLYVRVDMLPQTMHKLNLTSFW